MVHPDGPPDRHPMGLGAAEAEFQALALVTATAAVLATPEVEIQFLHLKSEKKIKETKSNKTEFKSGRSSQSTQWSHEKRLTNVERC